jgi:hypothetical protein
MDVVFRAINDERDAVHTLHCAREIAMHLGTEVGSEKSRTSFCRKDEVIDQVAVRLRHSIRLS